MYYKVYLISSGDFEKQYKIGYTRRDVEDRVKEFKTGNSNNLEIISVFESKWGTKIESSLHRKYKTKKIDGEWFDLNQEDVDSFKLECERIHDMFELISNQNTYIIDRGGLNKQSSN